MNLTHTENSIWNCLDYLYDLNRENTTPGRIIELERLEDIHLRFLLNSK